MTSTFFQHSPVNIFEAAAKGNQNQLIQLLNRGKNINSQNEEDGTCLHYAVMNLELETVELLLEKNIDTSIKNNYGLTALELAEHWRSRLAKKHDNLLKPYNLMKKELNLKAEKRGETALAIMDKIIEKLKHPHKTPARSAGLRHS